MKKVISLGLMLALFGLYMPAFSNVEGETLADFLKSTKRISVKQDFPNMTLAAASNGKSVIKGHTPVAIRATETITTKDIVTGGTVHFAMVDNVLDDNGRVLIKSGSPVTATISFAKKRGMIGQSGEITVSDFHTIAVDGTYVPLSGSISAKPDDKMVLSVVLSVCVCPLFLLLKGDEARVEAGTTKPAYTIQDIYVKPVVL